MTESPATLAPLTPTARIDQVSPMRTPAQIAFVYLALGQ